MTTETTPTAPASRRPGRRANPNLVDISVSLPEDELAAIDALVSAGNWPSRSFLLREMAKAWLRDRRGKK